MALVTVIALGLGAVCMWKVHQFSEPKPVTTVNGPQAPEEFNPKRLTYELSGSVGSGGMLVYVDIDGHPHRVDIKALLSGSISAHVHGGQAVCRMLVDGVVRDQQSTTHSDADVQCRVKSA
jgi:hypothetical protein